jgi:hypothetical protein
MSTSEYCDQSSQLAGNSWEVRSGRKAVGSAVHEAMLIRLRPARQILNGVSLIYREN